MLIAGQMYVLFIVVFCLSVKWFLHRTVPLPSPVKGEGQKEGLH